MKSLCVAQGAYAERLEPVEMELPVFVSLLPRVYPRNPIPYRYWSEG